MSLETKTACFIGHRKIEATDKMRNTLFSKIEDLIINKGYTVFLFGCNSQFNDLCYETVTCLKEKYPYITRVFVRAKYPYIGESYKKYLLEKYDDTYFPEKMINSGRACYVERNFEMIEKSSCCVFYYDYYCDTSFDKKSGTKIALEYAKNKGRKIINITR